MDVLRRNPLFFSAMGLAVLLFAGGIFLFLGARKERVRAAGELDLLLARIRGLQVAMPAPTEANLAAAGENVTDLHRTLLMAEADLQRGAEMEVITDGVRLMAAIQEHIAAFRTRTRTADPPVAVPDGFAFGFDLYARESSPPAEAFIPAVDRQRQVLAFLLERLVRSGPESITEVRRERIEGPAEPERRLRGFTIDPAISARVPGVVDSLAFRIGFTGYTESLRRFLSALAAFEMPVVVRGVEVRRPGGTAVASPDSDDIFSIFGSEAGTIAESERTEEQRPVIEENLSEFTLTLEFIELIPTAEGGAPGDV